MEIISTETPEEIHFKYEIGDSIHFLKPSYKSKSSGRGIIADRMKVETNGTLQVFYVIGDENMKFFDPVILEEDNIIDFGPILLLEIIEVNEKK